jgi:hypothetical protein
MAETLPEVVYRPLQGKLRQFLYVILTCTDLKSRGWGWLPPENACERLIFSPEE